MLIVVGSGDATQVKEKDRGSILSEVWRNYERDATAILKPRKPMSDDPAKGAESSSKECSADIYDAMAVAYLLQYMRGSASDNSGSREATFVPLYRAIETAEVREQGGGRRTGGSSAGTYTFVPPSWVS